jgi:murein DD-endopeptidase MepM/ murein hydrolase activator NlpD
MAKQFYTVLVLPDATAPARKFHIRKAVLGGLALGLAGVLGAGAFFCTQYVSLHGRLLELKQLRLEAADRTALATQLSQLAGELGKLRDLDRRVRGIVGLDTPPAPPPPLAQGGADPGSQPALRTALTQRTGRFGEWAPRDLTALGAEITAREQSLRALKTYLEEKAAVLAATPTILPVRGLVTAGYGYRKSPFTGAREFHEGLDIAAPYGTPILATADGLVAFAGPLAAYGNVVFLDHGQGFATFYGHNSTNRVREGQRVHRGDVVAYVGTTGRTTGPHVHYEVHVHGALANPLQYTVDTTGVRFAGEGEADAPS